MRKVNLQGKCGCLKKRGLVGAGAGVGENSTTVLQRDPAVVRIAGQLGLLS